MKLVFFGSGPVGLASLRALLDNFEVEAVFTKPDPRSSRAPRLVADFARSNGLKLLQPRSKSELSQLILSENFESRLGVVVDYGVIIPKDVIDSFELGIINSHFSLLPEWRGADPITFSLLSGQQTTGVSLMLIVPELDEGDLLLQQKYQITADETIQSLTAQLINLSNTMLVETIPAYLEDMVHPYKQDETKQPSYSQKLAKSDGQIDWNKPATRLEREVRAYLGWPGSRTTIAGKDVTILEATASDKHGKVGTFEADNKLIRAYCGDGSLEIRRLKPAGKTAMSAEAFLAGNRL